MKHLSYIFLFLVLSLGSSWSEQTLQAGVTKAWTVDTAREEAFKGALPSIDTSSFSRVDPNGLENHMAIFKKQRRIGKRSITVFGTGNYAVCELCSLQSYYYDRSGVLTAVGFSDVPGFNSPECPDKKPISRQYKHEYPSGELIYISLSVARHESYQFNHDGSLSSHWVGSKCYELDGSSCGIRMSYRE